MAKDSIIKKLFSSAGIFNEAQLKIFRYLLVLILVGVLILMMGDFTKQNIKQDAANKSIASEQEEKESDYNTEIEARIESLLTQIEGVGEVSVSINFDTGSEYIYARDEQKNINKNKDESGNLERIQEDISKDIVVLRKQNDDEALVKKEIKPKIRGVLIVAQGADNIRVKARLLEAIQVGLGVEAHKITVLPKD